jgi:hypothetical protein
VLRLVVLLFFARRVDVQLLVVINRGVTVTKKLNTDLLAYAAEAREREWKRP